MTIARDIENTASNWESGTVGSGMIPRAHTDSGVDGTDCIASPCPADMTMAMDILERTIIQDKHGALERGN